MEHSVLPHPSMVERLIVLARRLEKLRRPAEAAELLEVAAALSPQGTELRRLAKNLRSQEPGDDFELELKRRALEASHAMGMGHIMQRRGETARAMELFDLAKLRTPFHYLAYAASGYLSLRRGDAATALQEFVQARRLNPLDHRLAIEASRAALQCDDYETALEHAVDAMLLAQWSSDREQEQEVRRVDTLSRLCSLTPTDIDEVIRSHSTALQKACDHVALSHAKLFSGGRLPRRKRLAPEPEPENLIQDAAELRAMPVFQHFADDHLIALARRLEPVSFKPAEVIFREEEKGRDLFVIRSGTVHVTRRTPAGTQILAALEPGGLIGEVSFLDSQPRSATAFGVGNGTLFRLSAEQAESAMRDDRDLAVALLWAFWHTLADKLRAANGQMGEILTGYTDSVTPARRRHPGRPARLSREAKLGVLQEQGLSAQELRLLATYSHEGSFPADALVFTEGERGDALYIVVDGKVRISRLVPGMGEECLSIIGRGELFGEMALIDDKPRSADARAHDDGCTVFSVSRSQLREVLSMDPDAAIQFLGLLCRLMCRRLRAMNDRLVAWRVMASHQ